MIERSVLRSAIFVVFLAISISGCSQKESAEPGVVDYLSGAEQLKTYKQTRTKIEDLGKAVKERDQGIQ